MVLSPRIIQAMEIPQLPMPALQERIDAEDKSKPFDDDQLAEKLQKHGIKIARRTVAKHRRLMNISPVRKRRQY